LIFQRGHLLFPKRENRQTNHDILPDFIEESSVGAGSSERNIVRDFHILMDSIARDQIREELRLLLFDH